MRSEYYKSLFLQTTNRHDIKPPAILGTCIKIQSCLLKGKCRKRTTKERLLAHIHDISNLTANGGEGSLERRGMELSIPSALKSTGLRRGRSLLIELPSNTFHSLYFSRCQGENLSANSAKGAIVIIQNSLITIFVTDVCEPSQFAAKHVPTHMLIFTFPIALVNRGVWPILTQ